MATLEQALAHFGGHPGVEQVLLLGRDGLVVQRAAAGGAEQAEMAAAAVPAFIAACNELGQMTERGPLRTAVLQLDRGVLIAQPLSGELVLAVLLRSGVAFGPLLAELRASREQILELI